MTKSLDAKLSRFAADPSCKDFILADAKDADMAFGIGAPGRTAGESEGVRKHKSIEEYRAQIGEIVRQGLVDIMLMSVSNAENVCYDEQIFDSSAVTPAIRANDTTDIWLAGTGARYDSQPSLPFRTASLPHLKQACEGTGATSIDLGLYSMTLNNDTVLDRASLEAYRDFWLEAESAGFRHFLEVFAPNACDSLKPREVPGFVNNSIVRTLAGMPKSCRPLFLKVPYFGPEAMEELAGYDSQLVVGIMGGSAGTTHDAFELLASAKRHGARAALFGRKINQAENQLAFVKHLRKVADDQLDATEAVRSYHAELKELGVKPARSLDDDMQLTDTSLSYSGGKN